jgi:hypothetical protein
MVSYFVVRILDLTIRGLVTSYRCIGETVSILEHTSPRAFTIQRININIFTTVITWNLTTASFSVPDKLQQQYTGLYLCNTRW